MNQPCLRFVETVYDSNHLTQACFQACSLSHTSEHVCFRAGLLIVASLLVLGPVFEYLPLSTLAVTIISSLSSLIKPNDIKMYWKVCGSTTSSPLLLLSHSCPCTSSSFPSVLLSFCPLHLASSFGLLLPSSPSLLAVFLSSTSPLLSFCPPLLLLSPSPFVLSSHPLLPLVCAAFSSGFRPVCGYLLVRPRIRHRDRHPRGRYPLPPAHVCVPARVRMCVCPSRLCVSPCVPISWLRGVHFL